MFVNGSRILQQCLFTALVACMCSRAGGYGLYDPCTNPGLATKSRGIYLGVAFWPGGTIEDWGVISETVANATTPLYPCTTNNNYNHSGLSDQAYLTSQGVVFAAFELRVDALMSLRVNYTDLLPLYQTIPLLNDSRPNVISAVMFRGGYRSEARYVVSADADVTTGLGWVTSLAGVMRFRDPVLGWSICNKYVYERPYECDLVDPDAQGLLTSTYSTASANVPADMGSELDLPPSKGTLSFLQWNDMTCNTCGGRSDKRCLQATTGTDAQRSCGTVATTCGVNSTDCSMQLYVGASGDDKYGVAFSSGWMIQEINRFSVLSLYDNSKMDLTNAVTSNTDAVIGTTPSASGSSQDGVAR